MKKSFSLSVLFFFAFASLTLAQKEFSKIQIEGKSQHYQLSEIENRKLGQPLIIFESDLGGNLDPWHQVISELPEGTLVFRYDRAGLGQSEAFDEIPIPANRTKQLERILSELELVPPYILVGHGWGGILIKDFALAHPNDIVAMIYLDPKDRSTSMDQMIALFDREGQKGEEIATDYFRLKRTLFQNAPAGVRAEAEVILDFEMNRISNSKLYDYPEVPSVIFVGSKHVSFMENPLNPSSGLNYQDIFNVVQKNRIEDFTEHTLASTNFEMVLTSENVHFLHLQAPEKISATILSKYIGDPAKKLISASERYSSEEFGKYLDGMLSYYPDRKITESTINMLGYDQLRRDQPEHALILFQHNLTRFPESANVYDSMGDGLVALGKTKEAVPYFEKAVALGEKSNHSDLGLFKKNLASAKEEK